jgi:anti-sigma factor RsiW
MDERFEKDSALLLTAFADGELDADLRAAVLEYLAAHPEQAARLVDEAHFRQAVARSMERAAPPAPAELRQRIERLTAEPLREDRPLVADRPAPGPIPIRQNSRGANGSLFRWVAALAALVCLVSGLVIGRMSGKDSAGTRPLPASLVSELTHTHVDCSRAPSLHNAPFPKELGNLEGPLKTYLGRPVPYPDLRPIGYEYVGAGPCAKPLENTAHLLYRSTREPITDTVSLFVQPFVGQVNIQEGKVYWAAGKDAAHPLMVWRKDGLVLYLVGDAPQPVSAAAGVMHVQ